MGNVRFSLSAGPSAALSGAGRVALPWLRSREPALFPLLEPPCNKKGVEKPSPFSVPRSLPAFQYRCRPQEPGERGARGSTRALRRQENNPGECGNLFALALRLLGWAAASYCRGATRCDSVHRAKQLRAQL